MSVENFVIKNYLECMKFSIENQTYFEINYEQTKELYNAIHKLLKENENQQKEIEELKAINQIRKYRIEVIDEREFISKDKIREKLNQIHNEFSDILLDKTLSLEEQNLNAHRYDAIRNVLEELLGDEK